MRHFHKDSREETSEDITEEVGSDMNLQQSPTSVSSETEEIQRIASYQEYSNYIDKSAKEASENLSDAHNPQTERTAVENPEASDDQPALRAPFQDESTSPQIRSLPQSTQNAKNVQDYGLEGNRRPEEEVATNMEITYMNDSYSILDLSSSAYNPFRSSKEPIASLDEQYGTPETFQVQPPQSNMRSTSQNIQQQNTIFYYPQTRGNHREKVLVTSQPHTVTNYRMIQPTDSPSTAAYNINYEPSPTLRNPVTLKQKNQFIRKGPIPGNHQKRVLFTSPATLANYRIIQPRESTSTAYNINPQKPIAPQNFAFSPQLMEQNQYVTQEQEHQPDRVEAIPGYSPQSSSVQPQPVVSANYFSGQSDQATEIDQQQFDSCPHSSMDQYEPSPQSPDDYDYEEQTDDWDLEKSSAGYDPLAGYVSDYMAVQDGQEKTKVVDQIHDQPISQTVDTHQKRVDSASYSSMDQYEPSPQSPDNYDYEEQTDDFDLKKSSAGYDPLAGYVSDYMAFQDGQNETNPVHRQHIPQILDIRQRMASRTPELIVADVPSECPLLEALLTSSSSSAPQVVSESDKRKSERRKYKSEHELQKYHRMTPEERLEFNRLRNQRAKIRQQENKRILAEAAKPDASPEALEAAEKVISRKRKHPGGKGMAYKRL